jgi:type VI secretion system protein ImpC
MSAKFSFGKMQFDVSLRAVASGTPRDPETPFGMAVLADFSGRTNRGTSERIGQRRVWQIDCDNFEEIMSKLDARLHLPLSQKPGGTTELPFRSMDDFHPDQLLKQVAPFAALLEQRSRLLNPSSAAAAATEAQKPLSSQPAPPPAQTPTPSSSESNADTLARLLGGHLPPATPATTSQSGAGVDHLIRGIVAPSIVPGATAQQTALLSAVELELTSQLRSLLHHPDFQALESAWRGLDLLVRNFGGEENIKLFLADISKEELAADLQAQDSLDSSGLFKLIRRQAEDQPWTIWLGLYTFGGGLADIEMLGRLAKVAAQARTPFLSGASPNLVGCDSFGQHPDPDDWKHALVAEVREAWQALRELSEASYLGLALPRFMLRQPYGKESDPIEAFPFEELAEGAPHEDYLWGNPAVLCGYSLAGAFQAEGWNMQAGGYGEVGGLPVHKVKENGETNVKPCAEAWLTERAAQAMLGKGLMPVLSIRGRDAVRLKALQSLAGTTFSLR